MRISELGRLSLVLVLVLLLGTLTGAVASAQGGTTTNITISETEFKLDPAQITVPLNTPVQFTVKNAGTVEHNLKFELPSANIEQNLFSQNLKPGETRTGSFTFTKAGSWEMYCPVDDHEGAGMKGTVMVVAAQAAAGQSQRAAPSTLPVTGAADSPANWVLAALVLAALGLGLRFATRTVHP
jgi:plastocyanin